MPKVALSVEGLFLGNNHKNHVTVFVLHNNSPQSPFNVNVKDCALYTLPDTAVQRNGKPMFVPDFAVPCTFHAHVALRLCRLGRSVSPRFAHRYWDAASVVAHFVATPLLEQAQREGLPWSCATGFDNALPVGDFVAKEALLAADPQLAHRIVTSAGQQLENTMPDVENIASEAIARISEFYMIRNGDVVLLPATGEGCSAVIDSHLEGFIAGNRVLSYNIK